VDAIERAIPIPQLEIIMQRRARRQVLGDGALATGAQHMRQPVDDLALVQLALAAARLAGGISGATSDHSSSVTSLGSRGRLRS